MRQAWGDALHRFLSLPGDHPLHNSAALEVLQAQGAMYVDELRKTEAAAMHPVNSAKVERLTRLISHNRILRQDLCLECPGNKSTMHAP